MGLFDFLKAANINQGLQQYRDTQGAVLLDVREADEFRQGHIAQSVNLPLSRIGSVEALVKDKHTPLFVYCLSGSRSGQAVRELVRMGYTAVTNIGGISGYRGEVERV